MPKKFYKAHRFDDRLMAMITIANEILEDYTSQGYDITLRQLYYQFVSRDLILNNDKEYDKLGAVISNARLAGLIDWEHIVDRTRKIRGLNHWDGPAEIVETCVHSFHIDKWIDQEYRIEVWVEKDALVGVIEKPCNALDIKYFSCRGYTSQSEMWAAATKRFIPHERRGQQTIILHLGDHDPSGIDMTRDIQERLHMFGSSVIVQRIALNMDQVERYNPPPNPAKMSDVRAQKYIAKYGPSSWELDALEPRVIDALITGMVKKLRDEKKWKVQVAEEKVHIAQLQMISDKWIAVTNDLETFPDDPIKEDESDKEDEENEDDD